MNNGFSRTASPLEIGERGSIAMPSRASLPLDSARAEILPTPHSPEAERAVLGAVLISNGQLAHVRAEVAPHDFFGERERLAYSAILRLAESGMALDLICLTQDLAAHGELEKAGGAAWVSALVDRIPKSTNAIQYARIVKEKATRRRIMSAAERLQTAASDGTSTEGLRSLFAEIEESVTGSIHPWKGSSLEGVASPEAGRVPYLVEGLLPRGELVVFGADWKSFKSLIAYGMVFDMLTARPVFGRFPVREALSIVIFQLEMAEWESERRFRNLAIGSGIPPEDFPSFTKSGQLGFYNRVDLDLTSPEGRARFHATVRQAQAKVVLIDSLIASVPGLDLNSNIAVREVFTRAFSPLTSEGRTVLLLHHHRKRMQGGGRDDGRSALLGAQAIGAASGRVYGIQRLPAPKHTKGQCREYRASLSLTGSWTPEDEDGPLILSIEDTDEGGTRVLSLSEQDQIAKGGVTQTQTGAIEIARLVRENPSTPRQQVLEAVQESLSISSTTAKQALRVAKQREWVASERALGGRNNESLLVPGPLADEV